VFYWDKETKEFRGIFPVLNTVVEPALSSLSRDKELVTKSVNKNYRRLLFEISGNLQWIWYNQLGPSGSGSGLGSVVGCL
jgi:hypothetical protein